MAAVNFTRGVKLLLKVETETPDTFAALCTINAERGFSITAATNEANIPDCSAPDQLSWLAREKVSLSADFTGGGMTDKSDVKKLMDWATSEDSKNCQIILDDDVADNVITFEGPFHLTQFDLTGNRGEKVTSTISLASDGEIVATYGANVGGT